ncbi:MAG: Ubiquinone biosynthesis O-methyltransferase [bacterium]|nr:Ubiquinone biosynthesis O-methyltransferase [bacterium]
MTTPIQHPRCPVCEGGDANVPYPGLPDLVECPACGLLFRSDWREIAAPNAAYEEANSSPDRLLAEESRRGPYYAEISRRILTVSGSSPAAGARRDSCASDPVIPRCAENHFSALEGPGTPIPMDPAREGIHAPAPTAGGSRSPGHGTLLEIGCGAGGLLTRLHAQGWTVEGIEPSGPLHAHARARLPAEVRVHPCALEEAEPRLVHRPYQAVVALDVIEHLPDPFVLPTTAAEWLAPGGLLFLQTPNARSIRRRLQGARWEQLAPEEHFLIHSPRSLRLVLELCGFKSARIETVGGGAVDGPLRRALMRPVGRLLSLCDLGNALWAVAIKDRP